MNTLLIYLLAGAATIAISFGAGWEVKGWKDDAAKLSEQKAQTEALIKVAENARALGIAEGTITFTAGEKFATAETKIVTRTVTITKEVPKYVTVKDDKACTIPLGFVRVHNAAAEGIDDPTAAIPDAASKPNDTSTSVALSDVASTITSNYGACNANAAQLDQLNDWIRDQQKLHK